LPFFAPFASTLLRPAIGRLNGIAEPDHPTIDNARDDSAVPAHGVVTPCSQHFFHPRTRFAGPGTFQDGIANAETAVSQEITTHRRTPASAR